MCGKDRGDASNITNTLEKLPGFIQEEVRRGEERGTGEDLLLLLLLLLLLFTLLEFFTSALADGFSLEF